MPLTDTQVKALKPGAKKTKVPDADGLYVEVLPTGRKTYRMRFSLGGQQRDLRIGQVEFVRLAEARQRRDMARSMIDRGEDPTAALASAQPEPVAQSVSDPNRPDGWERVSRGYLEYRKKRGANWRTMAKLERQIEQTIRAFGQRAVASVRAADILELVRPIEEAGKIEAAHEVRARCAQVFDYAEALGFANTNPARKIVGAMQPRKRGKWPGVTERAGIGRLMRDIRSFQHCEPETRWGLLLSAYLFPRSDQLRGARWDEVDIQAAVWEIPGLRMKGADAHDHVVPLSRQALAILAEIRDYTGGLGYVVPSPRGVDQKLSETAFNMALRRMGYDTKAVHCHHGFRTTASTTLNEMGFNRDWIERQLSHVEKDAVRAAYNKAQYLEGRTRMMQEYADWLDRAAAEQPE